MERKVVSIYANGIKEPTICITYIVQVDTDIGITFAKNVRFWLRDDKTEDMEILMIANNLLREILLASGNQLKIVKEKDIFIQYQKLYARESRCAYATRTDTFNTECLATTMKPYRNFTLIPKEFIKEQIQKIITKTEEPK
jgi:hypothetical protein